MNLYRVTIADADWDYDRFDSAVVAAPSPEDAVATIRQARRYPDDPDDDELWVGLGWGLRVDPIEVGSEPSILLVHWHAG